MAWENRIVKHDVLPAKDFLAHPMNFRLHPVLQQEALQGSLDELGWIDDVLVNIQTQHVLNGHLRISLALRQGDDTPVPVKYVSLSPAEELTALAVFDELTAMAGKDREKLDALLRDVQPESAALQQMLSELAAREGLYTGNGGGELGGAGEPSAKPPSLADRFVVPPFSVLDARQGYWQERKRAWLALGIQSELGRGENAIEESDGVNERHMSRGGPYGRASISPGGSPQDAATLGPDGKTVRGDGHGKPLSAHPIPGGGTGKNSARLFRGAGGYKSLKDRESQSDEKT